MNLKLNWIRLCIRARGFFIGKTSAKTRSTRKRPQENFPLYYKCYDEFSTVNKDDLEAAYQRMVKNPPIATTTGPFVPLDKIKKELDL